MRDLTVSKICEICEGAYYGDERVKSAGISSITTDSREVSGGALFTAIAGERYDGHDFAKSAMSGGAICCLLEKAPAGGDGEFPYILVRDTQEALRRVAAYYRSRFDIPFIGITGSVGKTTTKEMVAAVLSAKFNPLKTQGNFNNELGVPLTIFRLRDEHEAAILEMGISHFGEMTRLAEMVRPDVAVFTVIGDSHLEFLGDRDGVLRAKTELLPFVPESGAVFVNGDDDHLASLSVKQRLFSYGTGASCDFRAENIVSDGFERITCEVRFSGRRVSLSIPGYGLHLVHAAAAGVAVGAYYGLSDREIAQGIAAYETVGGRGVVTMGKRFTVVDDSYNANPASVASALSSLKDLPGRKIAILGDMGELGDAAEELHFKTGRDARGSGIDLLIACGAGAKDIFDGAGSGKDGFAVYFPDKKALIPELPSILNTGDSILVKASRFMKFEEIVAAIAEINAV